MTNPWYMEQPFKRLRDPLSREQLLKLRRFYTQQLALSQALLEAKPLGICKTTMSGGEVSLDTYPGVDTSLSSIMSDEDASKEMSS